MTTASSAKIRRIAGIGVFAAIVVILQLFASFITLGQFAITLALVPIVIGAALYGPLAGAALGATFSFIVLIMTITGVDVGGHMLWLANPVATALVILARGILAGAAAGWVYSLVARKSTYVGGISAAIICPVVNTGLLLAAMYFIFPDFMALWAGGAATVYFLFIGLAGVNFLIELAINIALSPAIVRVIQTVKKG
ncbi:MAG: ECF transporter S component [Defluviitaleaceae bacterium]|nr:ECF transporter S component [Defluviitaleaceae bacterium]